MAAINLMSANLRLTGQQLFLFYFIFTPPDLWSALNGSRAKIFQPDALGFVNLRDLRIVHDDLHHAIAQRIDLLPHNVQPGRFFTGTLNSFDFILAHF
jgi:hypothetical protein